MASTRYTQEQLRIAIESAQSWHSVCRTLGLKYAGGNTQHLKKKAQDNGWSTEHFLGQGWNLNGKAINEISLDDLLKKGTTCKSSSLKRKLIKAGLKQNICEECGQLPEWRGKPLVLELDHVNGDGDDNRLENLKILCLHCHSQTPTFRGRNNATVAKRQTRGS